MDIGSLESTLAWWNIDWTKINPKLIAATATLVFESCLPLSVGELRNSIIRPV